MPSHCEPEVGMYSRAWREIFIDGIDKHKYDEVNVRS